MPDLSMVRGGETVDGVERSDREHPVDLDVQRPVPAARPLSDFAVEVVGDELVIFDAETLHYHTLNATAQLVWRSCDGTASPVAIAQALDIPVELVQLTVAEFGEASLLSLPDHVWSSAVTRRRAAQLIAAGLVGTLGLPVVKSITVPDAAAAASNLPNGSSCAGSSECASTCCLDVSGAYDLCVANGGGFACNLIKQFGQVCSPGPIPAGPFTIPCM